MNSQSLMQTAPKAHALLVKCAGSLQSPLRRWWGWPYFLTGKGKLIQHADIADFFRSPGIPLPGRDAWVAAGVECVGGLCLLARFASRTSAIPLSIMMIVAYLTADHEALKNIFSDPDKFTAAARFLFLPTAVLAFGPGAFSVDRLQARKFLSVPVNANGGGHD